MRLASCRWCAVLLAAWLFAVLVQGEEPAKEGAGETHTPAEWREKLAAWRKALESDDEAQRREAKAAILSIRDPNAFGLLKYMLAREESLDVRRLLVAPMAGIGGRKVVDMLVELAMKDRAVWGEAAIGLGTMGEEDRALAVRRLSRYLRSKQLQARAVQVLALGELIRPLEQGARPDDALTRGLIDALALKATNYKKGKIYFSWYSFQGARTLSNQYRSSRVGGGIVDVVISIEVTSPNETAHELLQQYTQQQLPLDQDQWAQWYKSARATR